MATFSFSSIVTFSCALGVTTLSLQIEHENRLSCKIFDNFVAYFFQSMDVCYLFVNCNSSYDVPKELQ